MTMQPEQKALTQTTPIKIQLAAFVALLAFIVAGTWTIALKASGIQFSIESLDQRLESVKLDVGHIKDSLESSYLRRNEFRSWAEILSAKNPDLNLPEPIGR